MVHDDSKAQWLSGYSTSHASEAYTKNSELEFTEIDLKEAVEKAKRQVKFYDKNVHARTVATKLKSQARGEVDHRECTAHLAS